MGIMRVQRRWDAEAVQYNEDDPNSVKEISDWLLTIVEKGLVILPSVKNQSLHELHIDLYKGDSVVATMDIPDDYWLLYVSSGDLILMAPEDFEKTYVRAGVVS